MIESDTSCVREQSIFFFFKSIFFQMECQKSNHLSLPAWRFTLEGQRRAPAASLFMVQFNQFLPRRQIFMFVY